MYAVIGGQTVQIHHGTINGQSQVGQRGQLTLDVLDTSAAFAFTEGSAALLYDDSGDLLLARWVASAKRLRSSQAGMLYHQLTCVDNCYLADKRLAAYTATSRSAYNIFNDLLTNYLLAEGVYAVRNLLSVNQSNVETNTTGFTAVGSGTVTLTQDTAHAWQGTHALKVVADGTHASQGAFAGIAVSAGPFSAYEQITVSAYVYGTPGVAIAIALYQDTPAAIIGAAKVTTLVSGWQRISVTASLGMTLPSGNIGVLVQTNTATATTFWLDGLQVEPNPTGAVGPQTWEAGQTTTLGGSSITIGSFTSNYAQVSACFDAIVQKAQGGYAWWIDDTRRLYFLTSNPTAPPVSTIDDTIIERDTEYAQHGNTQYRNTQYILGGMAQTSQLTETRQGDSKATAFTMSYDLSSAPIITLNAVSQTVGVKGVDTGKNWYWAVGDPVIAQDPSGTKLVSTDTLSVTYYGQFPVVTQSQDGTGVSQRQTREGGSTSGIVEAVATDTTISNTSDGFAAANGFLARYSQDTQQFTFMTQTAGFLPGQSVTVNIPGMNLNNVTCLIQSVNLTDAGPIGAEVGVLYYTVTCIEGPLNTSGSAYWKALALTAQQIAIDAINVGSSGIVAILQSGAVAESLTVTGSATPYAAQFPSATLYPHNTLYPGGTAGTPVSITWTKTQAGLNAIRDVLSGAGSTFKVGYLAWGTGTQGTPSTATQLAAESGRKLVASITNGGSVGEELINGIIGPTDGVGVAITEVGFFAGPAAGAGANTGVMLLYGLYSHTHTASESLQITADATFS